MWIPKITFVWWVLCTFTSRAEENCEDGIQYSNRSRDNNKPSDCPLCPRAANEWNTNINYHPFNGGRSVNISFQSAPCGCGFSSYKVELLEDERSVLQKDKIPDNYMGQVLKTTFTHMKCNTTYTAYVMPIFHHKETKKCCPNCRGECYTDYTNTCLRTKLKNIKLACVDNLTINLKGNSSSGSLVSEPSSIVTTSEGSITDAQYSDTESERTVTGSSMPAELPSPASLPRTINTQSEGTTRKGELRENEPPSYVAVVVLPLMGIFICVLFGLVLYYFLTSKKKNLCPPTQEKDQPVSVAVVNTNHEQSGYNNNQCSSNQSPNLQDMTPDRLIAAANQCSSNQILKVPDMTPDKSIAGTQCSSNQLANLPDMTPDKSVAEKDKPVTAVNTNYEQSRHIAANQCSSNQILKVPDMTPDKSITENMLVSQLSALENIPQKRVFILYEDDHALHKNVINCLATFLKEICNCEVIFDEWCMYQLSGDVLTWYLNEIGHADKCLIIVSQGAYAQYRAHCDKIKLEYSSPKTKDVFGPAIWKVKQEFHEQNKHNINKYVHVSFPYSEKNVTGKDYIIRDIYPGMCFRLMDHIEDLVMNIHGFQKLSPGKSHAISGVSKETFCMYKEGRALKEAIDKMSKLVRNDPEWYTSQCQSLPMDSGVSTLSREYSTEELPPTLQVSKVFKRPNNNGIGREEGYIPSILPNDLFLPSTDKSVSKENGGQSINRHLPSETGHFVSDQCVSVKNNCHLPIKSDYSEHREHVSPSDMPIFDIGMDLHGETVSPTYLPDLEMPSGMQFIPPVQTILNSDCDSDLFNFLENGSVSDAKYYVKLEGSQIVPEGAHILCHDYNDDNAYSV